MAQSISGGGGGSAHGALGSSAIAGLMAMADYCLIHKPQQIKEAVHCMMACLSLSPPPRVEARVRLQLGLTLYHHSNNLLEARETLEQAMLLSNSVSGIEQIRYEAASILGRIHLEQGYASKAKVVLKSVMETSHRLSYWHCRLLLQKADIHLYEKDFDSLISTLTAAADYAHQVNAPHTRILCLLAKGAHLLILKQHQEATATLNLTLTLVDQCQGSKAILLKTFYLIIQVTHLLGFGLMKAAKPHLKELQHNVKLLNSEAQRPVEPEGLLTAESFEWLTVEQTYILVYLVCMMHSVLVGSTEKALSFAKKALYVINSRKGSSGSGNASVLLVFEAHILELIVSCMLMQGNCVEAGEKLQEVVNVCHKHPQMVYSHRAVLHSLLGAYAFTTNDDERSVLQFQAALQHTNSLELKVYINVNLAITYLRIGASKIRELMAIMDFLQSEDVNSLNSKNLKAAVLFVKGLNAYYQVRPHEAKRHLRETLSLSNSNDLNKLSACALLVLGQIFLSLGNSKEARDMLDPAFKLSHKMRDKKLQSWATSLLIGLHKSVEDKGSQESSEESLRILQSELLTDYTKAKESSHHSLIQWTVGDWPIREEEGMETGSVPVATAMVADDRRDYGTREEMDTADLRARHVTDHVSKHVIPQNDYLTSGTGHVTSDHVTSHATSRANRRLSHKGHRTDHVISQTDHVTNQSGSQKSDFMQSARHVTGHVTGKRDHVALHENGRHSQINQPFQPHHMTSEQDHMTSEQGHVTSKHRSSVDHMTLHSNRTPHSHVDTNNRTDHMTLHVNHPLTSNKKTMPITGGGEMRDEIPLDVSVKQRKSDKSPQLPFNQGSSSSGLFSPPPLTHSPSYPTPPAGSNSPYSRYYSHLPPSSSSPIPTTLTPPPSDQASVTTHTPRQHQKPHHFSSHSSRVGSDSLHASGGQHQLQHSSQSSSPSLQGYSSSAPQLGAGRQHRTTPHQANSANSQLYSAASQPEHTASSQYSHVPSSKQQGPATSQSPVQSASSEYAALHKQHSITSSNTQGTSPQYTAPKHTSPQYTGHSSPQYSSPLQHQQKQQQQQHNPASAQQGSSPGVHQGVTGHQPGLSSPLLHSLPQLKHMGTLPSADSVLMRSYPSPGGNHSPHVARGSPSQPSSAAASPYQANSLSLLQQQQVPGGVLMQQQFPHVYNSPTQRQLQHHQLQQQQFPGNDMVLHQYGYSALTPEALMRQREKLAQQQQQLIPTGGAAAGGFSPFPHHHPVLGGGALQYRTQAPRMNLYQYHAGGAQVPPSSLSPPTPGHLNYIYHHRNLSKNPNMPHQ